jgi:hypothetical protein
MAVGAVYPREAAVDRKGQELVVGAQAGAECAGQFPVFFGPRYKEDRRPQSYNPILNSSTMLESLQSSFLLICKMVFSLTQDHSQVFLLCDRSLCCPGSQEFCCVLPRFHGVFSGPREQTGQEKAVEHWEREDGQDILGEQNGSLWTLCYGDGLGRSLSDHNPV